MVTHVPPGALLSAAQRASRRGTAATGPRLGSDAGQVIGTLLRFTDLTDVTVTTTTVTRAEVTVDGATVWLPANPGTYRIGGPVWVAVTTDRRPVRVLGPAGDRPGADRYTHLPELILDEEARQDLAVAEETLAEAKEDLDAARPLLDAIRAAETAEQVAQAIKDYLQVTLTDLAPGDPIPEVVTDFWDKVVVARFLIASEKIITKDVLADGSVTTRTLAVVPESDEVGGFLLTPTGYVLLDPNGSDAVRLSTDGPTTFGIVRDGAYVAAITDDGTIAGTSVKSQGDITFNGARSLTEALEGGGGRTLAKTQLSNATMIDVTRRGLLGATFQLPGQGARQIKVTGQVQASVTPSPRSVALTLHFAEGETVTTANTVRAQVDEATNSQNRSLATVTFSLNTAELGVTDDRAVLSVMMAAQSDSGGTWDAHSGTPTFLLVEDMGPAVPTSRTVIQTADPSRPTQNSVGSRQDVFLTQAWGTYDQNGAKVPLGKLYQGRSPAYPAPGRRRAAVQFPDLSGVLAGATVEWVEIDILSDHWHFTGGGTVSVGVKDGLLPASLPDSAIGAHSLAQTHMDRGETKTIRLPSAVHAGIKSGATRCITFFTTSGSGEFYGTFDPASFRIRVRYQK